jgi:hypothetical protein
MIRNVFRERAPVRDFAPACQSIFSMSSGATSRTSNGPIPTPGLMMYRRSVSSYDANVFGCTATRTRLSQTCSAKSLTLIFGCTASLTSRRGRPGPLSVIFASRRLAAA